MAKRPRPQVILNPDVADDDDVPTLGVPDEDGWVYLKRRKQQEQEQRAKKPKPKKRPR